jgi:hypothetical protein
VSAFRFVASSRRGAYSVHRGDEWIGYVERVVHTYRGRPITTGWRPTFPDRRELDVAPNRETAATALWRQRAP